MIFHWIFGIMERLGILTLNAFWISGLPLSVSRILWTISPFIKKLSAVTETKCQIERLRNSNDLLHLNAMLCGLILSNSTKYGKIFLPTLAWNDTVISFLITRLWFRLLATSVFFEFLNITNPIRYLGWRWLVPLFNKKRYCTKVLIFYSFLYRIKNLNVRNGSTSDRCYSIDSI